MHDLLFERRNDRRFFGPEPCLWQASRQARTSTGLNERAGSCAVGNVRIRYPSLLHRPLASFPFAHTSLRVCDLLFERGNGRRVRAGNAIWLRPRIDSCALAAALSRFLLAGMRFPRFRRAPHRMAYKPPACGCTFPERFQPCRRLGLSGVIAISVVCGVGTFKPFDIVKDNPHDLIASQNPDCLFHSFPWGFRRPHHQQCGVCLSFQCQNLSHRNRRWRINYYPIKIGRYALKELRNEDTGQETIGALRRAAGGRKVKSERFNSANGCFRVNPIFMALAQASPWIKAQLFTQGKAQAHQPLEEARDVGPAAITA